jgi:predicted chitinase
LIYALAISAFDSNDNHFLRTLTADTSQGVNPHKAMNGGEAYVKWLNQRLPTYSGGGQYPVFIVSAEGGGIYAAYNAAVFLSRMQDLCPDFHNHLFAISSVSGGSIGAATFTAALDAIGQTKTLSQYSNDPCPSITQFLSRSQGNDSLEDGGLVEQMVDAALSADFLSPLVAATFFNDFSQQLIPHPVGLLDRARALEYALEDATDKIYRFNSIGKKSNIVRTAFQDYWTPEGPLPALLMNATDSSTGKRIVIAPFKINPQDSPTSEVCDLDAQNSSEHFAISSAAFVSARFPWVSPAATTNIINSCMGQTDENPVPKTRLVDGGYIDNSGVETALNLVTQMKLAATQNHLENSVAVYLISLSGGDFPSNRAFDFGEIAEPIRALLNGREARAYIAINRAQDMLNPRASTGLTSRSLPSFNVTKLQNNFYAMPLGWAISSKTREIIALDSGRFWDCVAGKNFQQADPLKSNADCVQLQIYHLLNNSAATALDDLNTAAAIASELAKSAGATARTELDHEVVLGCYESEWWQRKKSAVAGRVRYLAQYQAEYLDELLRERDRRDNIGNDFLAYILGSISFDSDDFRRTTDNLSFKSVDEIPPSWKAEIAMINRKRANAQPPVPQIDISSLLNNPKRFAEVVWGWEGNVFGNNIGNDGKYDGSIGDGWRYRERGIYQQIGYEQYSDDAKWLSQDDPSFTIDVLHQPDAMSNPTVSARVAFAHFMNWTSNGARGRDQRSAQRRSRDLMNMKLVDVFKKYPGDFAAARLNQTDMGDGGPGDLESVSVRSNMFRSCIDKALQRRK